MYPPGRAQEYGEVTKAAAQKRPRYRVRRCTRHGGGERAVRIAAARAIAVDSDVQRGLAERQADALVGIGRRGKRERDIAAYLLSEIQGDVRATAHDGSRLPAE